MTWWKAAFVRAIKTFSQALITGLTLGNSVGVDLLKVDWVTSLSLSGGAALLSILMSIIGLPEVDQQAVMQAQRPKRFPRSGV